MINQWQCFDELWDYNQPAETEAKFRALLPQAPEADPVRWELLTQIARTEGLQRKFTEAHRTLDEVESLVGDSPSRVRTRYLLERGRVFNSSGESQQARPLFTAAWEEGSQIEQDGLAVDAAHMLAIVDVDKAMEWNRRALELAQRSSDPDVQRWLGSLYNNIGWTLHDQGDFAAALDVFRQALDWRKVQGEPGPIQVAHWCIARTLRSLKRLDQAIVIQLALKIEHEAAGTSDGYVTEELAECYAAQGRFDEARPLFAQAHQELSADPWLAEKEPERIARLKQLGEV